MLQYATTQTDETFLGQGLAFRYETRPRWLFWLSACGVPLLLILAASPAFFTLLFSVNMQALSPSSFLSRIAQSAIFIGPVALLLAQRRFDFSIVAQCWLAAVVMRLIANDQSDPLLVLVGIAVAVGVMLTIGLIHATLVFVCRLDSVLVTLMSSALIFAVIVQAGAPHAVSSRGARIGPTSSAFSGDSMLLALCGLSLTAAFLLSFWWTYRAPVAELQARRREWVIGFSSYGMISLAAVALSATIGGIREHRFENAAAPTVALFATVLIGGTVVGGRMPNVIGALVACVALVCLELPAPADSYLYLFQSSILPILLAFAVAVASARIARQVTRGYAGEAFEIPHWSAWAVAGVLTFLGGIVLLFIWVGNLGTSPAPRGRAYIQARQIDATTFVQMVSVAVLACGLVLFAGYVAELILRQRRWKYPTRKVESDGFEV